MDKCFIIMPITTPESNIELYSSDEDHFKHVLEHLFIPAIEKAELKPILPLAKGADLIQAEIIKNLENAELVLCDISILNPNVFFELGIRTALNKPVCHVKDDITDNIPFDTGIINHYTYKADLVPWNINDEIDNLSKHILESIGGDKNENTLWKYFGLTTVAHPEHGEGTTDDHLALLNMKIDSLRKIIVKQEKSTDLISNSDFDWELAEITDLAKRVVDLRKIKQKVIKRMEEMDPREKDQKDTIQIFENVIKDLEEMLKKEAMRASVYKE